MNAARHPLADLVDRVREMNGWSDPQVVERARARGFELSKSNISRVRNQPVVSLTRSTIEGLAAGLGIPTSEVARAALESMGIELVDAGTLDLETVIRMDATLPLVSKEMLLGLVRQMRTLETRRSTDEGTGEATQAGVQEAAGKDGGPGAPKIGAAGRGNVTPLIQPDEGGELETKRAASDRIIETEDNTPGE